MLHNKLGLPLVTFLSQEACWFAWDEGDSERSLSTPTAAGTFRKRKQLGLLLDGAQLNAREEESYWGQVGRWAVSLLERQRWLPLLRPRGQSLAAYRAPCWDLEEDAQIFRHFLEHLPGCALFPWEMPRAALSQAVELLLEAAAESRLAALPPLRVPARWPDEARGWLEAHAGLGDLELDRPAVRLARDLVAWSQRLVGTQGAWRTCFSLHEPDLEEVDWRLSVGLQARSEPSLILEAALIWSGEAAQLAASAGHPLLRGAETLLSDLGRAARWCPELGEMLHERHPEDTMLPMPAVGRFVRETAWLLQESGYAVRLPASLSSKGRARLKLRSRRSGSKAESDGSLKLERILQFHWEAEVNGQLLTVEELSQLAKAKQPLVRLKGQWMWLEPGTAGQLLELSRRPEVPLGEALQALNSPAAAELELDLEDALSQLQGEGQLTELESPAALQAKLRPYQLRGYSWLAFLAERGLGACLADDMGLGKTIQLISHLLRDRELNGAAPVLLVCPTSVLGNWQREVQRFAPDLPVRLFYGNERSLELPEAPLVLTSYALAAREVERLRDIPWRGLVLDEAQNIKNAETLQSRAIRQLPAEFRVALTGTPVENRLQELWSLMDFLNPGLLGTRQAFQTRFARPIERESSAEALEQLQRLVRPFLLRRLKSDPDIVPDLPDKQETKTYCPLTSEQATLYAAVLQETMGQIESKEGIERRGLILKLLMQLKQVCNHPALFLDDGTRLSERSGKLIRLEEMLAEAAQSGEASLIFSQFAGFAQRLAQHLSQVLRVPVSCLHGGLRKPERDRLVEEFQSPAGPPLMVLSLKAGGVGLNLTRASRVFHFDRWWNPAVENQATDRAYRIGQQRCVQVYKFICDGTLEDAVDQMIDKKQSLARNVLSADESWLTELDNGALRELIALRL